MKAAKCLASEAMYRLRAVALSNVIYQSGVNKIGLNKTKTTVVYDTFSNFEDLTLLLLNNVYSASVKVL